MKLIFLLILAILSYSIEERTCTVYGSISKSNYLTIKPDNKYYCVYLDTNDFDSNTKEIEIYATVYNGRFTETFMYYGFTNNIVSSDKYAVLNTFKYNDYSSYSSSDYYSYNGYRYYDDYTYYFKIPKNYGRYLYISVPDSINYVGGGYKVEIGVSSGLAVWVIIVIIIAAIAVIAGIIVTIICCRRRRYGGYIAPVSGPIAPLSPMISPNPNVY